MPDAPLQPDVVRELRELTEAATPGPWVAKTLSSADGPQIGRPSDKEWEASVCDHGTPANGGGGLHNGADAELIVATRNALPALLARLDALTAEVEAGRAVIEAAERVSNWMAQDRYTQVEKVDGGNALADALRRRVIEGGEG